MARTRYRINNSDEIKETMQKLVEDVRQGKIKLNEARVITSMVRVQLDTIKIVDQERRIEEIEEQLEIRERGQY
mgnify:CR=1 FL=1